MHGLEECSALFPGISGKSKFYGALEEAMCKQDMIG